MRLHAAMLAILVLTSCASIDLNAGASSAAASADPSLNEWKPEIAGVYPLFPGQSKNIDDSYGVNVAVWPTNPVLCTRPPSPRVGLYVSKNGDPGDLVTEPPSVSTQ